MFAICTDHFLFFQGVYFYENYMFYLFFIVYVCISAQRGAKAIRYIFRYLSTWTVAENGRELRVCQGIWQQSKFSCVSLHLLNILLLIHVRDLELSFKLIILTDI